MQLNTDILTIPALLPLISAVFVLCLGIFVFSKNRKLKVNQIFFLFTICLTIWLFATFMMFTSEEDARIIFWDRIVYIGVIFIPITIYHFSLEFAKIEAKRKLLYLGYFLSIIFLILSRTNYFVEDLYKYSWGSHTQARFFHHVFLVFFTFYILLFLLNIWRYHQRVKGVERAQAKYVLLLTPAFIFGSPAFLPAYGISVYPVPYLSVIFGSVCLAYAITKHYLFEIKVILTELLVGAMGVILLILPLLVETLQLRILTTGILLLFCIFGYFLVRYTHEEIAYKEKLHKKEEGL